MGEERAVLGTHAAPWGTYCVALRVQGGGGGGGSDAPRKPTHATPEIKVRSGLQHLPHNRASPPSAPGRWAAPLQSDSTAESRAAKVSEFSMRV